MSQTITKSIGQGFAKNPIYAALAYDATDRFGGYEIKDVMHNTTYRTYFYDTGAYIYATASTALAIGATTIGLTATTTTVTGNLVVTGSLTYASISSTISQDLQGSLTVGVNDQGYDVKFYGDGTGKYWLWDTNKDTNEGGVTMVGTFGITGAMAITGALSVSTTTTLTGDVTLAADLFSGSANDGNDVTFYGAAGSGAWKWVYDQDTNGGVLLVGSFLQTGNMTITGTLTVGVDNTGHDVKFYGATQNKYWLWDEDVDTMILVGPASLTGAVTIVGAIGITGAITMATSNQINFYDTTQYIKASTDAILNIVGPTIDLEASTAIALDGDTTIADAHTFGTGTGAVSLNGDVTISGAKTFATGTGNVTLAGNVTISGTKTFTSGTGNISLTGAITVTNTLTVGVDGTGHDVKFYGDTTGTYMLWDQDADKLVINIVDRAASLSAITATATLDGPTSYYYGIQSSITKSGTDTIDDCTAVTAYLLQTTGNFTVTGRFAPLQVLISGSGTVGTITKTGVGAVYAAWIANRGTQTNTDSILCVHNQSAATATSAIQIENLGSMTNIFEIDAGATTYFADFDSVEGCVVTQAGGTITVTEKLKVLVGANIRYIPIGTIA